MVRFNQQILLLNLFLGQYSIKKRDSGIINDKTKAKSKYHKEYNSSETLELINERVNNAIVFVGVLEVNLMNLYYPLQN